MNQLALLLVQRQFFQRRNIMTTIDQRYSTAIRSRDLHADPKTVRSDSDVLGAMGLADRTLTRGHDGRGDPVPPDGLAVPLMRLLAGDRHAAREIVECLSSAIYSRSFVLQVRISWRDCREMAMASLVWFRDGRCKACGGHGKLLIPDTLILGNQDCDTCHGAGLRPFEHAFPRKRRVLATWLIGEINRSLGRAGPQAMAHLAPQLSLEGDER